MRRGRLALVGLGTLLVGALGAGTASAAPFEEPVSVTATAPARVSAGVPFQLRVEVAAEAGALAIAAAPLRLRVKFEPECGGSFAGTEGPVAIDRALPAPAGGAYTQTVTANPTLGALGPETVCAFVEDGQERQFATDTEEELTVVSGGAVATQCSAAAATVRKVKRSLKKLDRRIRRLQHRIKHTANGGKRTAEKRHLKKLRKRRHRLAHRKHRAQRILSRCGAR